jgi:uncharacterized protein (DUF2236 family)
VSRVTAVPQLLRERANRNLRRVIGLDREPSPICLDPDLAYVPLDAVARVAHADLPSMLIGGLGSLFLQMLHPHTMAGVAQHSRYQEDALGRVLQTANFIGVTTYGTRDEAGEAIRQVLKIHEFVRGVADDGVDYDANDPHLLAWVHAAGTRMFLSSFETFARIRPTASMADAYVAEVAQTARDLGAEEPPTTVAELDAVLEAFRPELRLTDDGRTARDFIARGVVRGLHQRTAYLLLVDSAFSILPTWAADLLEVAPRAQRGRVARPATRALNASLRLAFPPRTPTSD